MRYLLSSLVALALLLPQATWGQVKDDGKYLPPPTNQKELDLKAPELKAPELNAPELKGGDPKETLTPKSSASQATESKPVESKPVESKPVETKPVETKPVETKPVETNAAQADKKAPDKVKKGPPVAEAPPGRFSGLNGRIIVFVADAEGSFGQGSENLREALGQNRQAVLLQKVPWARWDDARKDYRDVEAHLGAGRALAAQITAIRKDAPSAYIFLIGFSSGTRVVLAVLEGVQPGAVDRAFLLGSSVSANYDLRAALRGTRGGIDNYFNREDNFLESREEKWGTADGLFSPAAGRVGFVVPTPPSPAPGAKLPQPLAKEKDKEAVKEAASNVALYRGLRQFQWTEEMGGIGTHHYWSRERFLRNRIVPQLFQVQVVVR